MFRLLRAKSSDQNCNWRNGVRFFSANRVSANREDTSRSCNERAKTITILWI